MGTGIFAPCVGWISPVFTGSWRTLLVTFLFFCKFTFGVFFRFCCSWVFSGGLCLRYVGLWTFCCPSHVETLRLPVSFSAIISLRL